MNSDAGHDFKSPLQKNNFTNQIGRVRPFEIIDLKIYIFTFNPFRLCKLIIASLI